MPSASQKLAPLATEIDAQMAQLTEIEKRLGTADERPDDIDRVRELAHGLRNHLTVIGLKVDHLGYLTKR